MRTLFAVLVVVVVVVGLRAQEKVTLTTPVQTDPGASEFRVSSLYLNLLGSEIRGVFTEVQAGTNTFLPSGKSLVCAYTGTQADNFLKLMNKSDFTTTSMQKQFMQKCQNDGKVPPGTISGTPQ